MPQTFLHKSSQMRKAIELIPRGHNMHCLYYVMILYKITSDLFSLSIFLYNATLVPRFPRFGSFIQLIMTIFSEVSALRDSCLMDYLLKIFYDSCTYSFSRAFEFAGIVCMLQMSN